MLSKGPALYADFWLKLQSSGSALRNETRLRILKEVLRTAMRKLQKVSELRLPRSLMLTGLQLVENIGTVKEECLKGDVHIQIYRTFLPVPHPKHAHATE